MHLHLEKFKLFLFWGIALLFLAMSCDNPEGGSNVSPVTDTAKRAPENTKKDTAIAEQREFPKLDNENAEAFLMKYFEENPERKIRVITRVGTLEVKLFDDTPLHTANFLMMTKREYFTGTEFIRVVPDFIVQGGNNESETEEIKRLLIGSYQIPAEFRDHHIHRRGALAMARSYENNPEKKSSAYYFYFVHGMPFNEPQLLALERDHDISIPEWKRKIYRTEGGAPHLDNEHTVFGEIYRGWDVLDKMASVETDDGDWPLQPLEMKVEVIDE